MKTKNILLNLISLILIIFLFSGCSSGQRETADFMNNASNIFVNSKSLNTLSFRVALFSKQKIEKIDYVGIAGVNVNNNDYTVNIIDNNIDVLNSYKYKDLYIKYIMVEIIAKGDVENCTINGKYAAGGLFGLVTADGKNTISDNTVKNCDIYCEVPSGNSYNGIGEVVGRSASDKVVIENNMTENVTLH